MPPKKRKGKGKGKGKAVPEQKQQEPQTTTRAQEAPVCVPVTAPESGKDTNDGKSSTLEETKQTTSKKEIHTTPEALGLYLEQALTLSTPFAKRPDYGTKGKKIGLTVNYFPVELPSGDVYHYDIEISLRRRDSVESASAVPESSGNKFRCLNTKKNRKVINAMLHQHREFQGYVPAYDGQKNLYTKTPLKIPPLPVLVELPVEVRGTRPPEDPLPRGDMFEVSIKPVYKKDTNNNAISLDPLHALYDRTVNEVPQEAVMAVETVLRNGPCFRYVPIRRSFFNPPQSPQDFHPLGGSKEIWFGYHQGLILAEWQPVVNINIAATTFRKSGPVIDYISEILGCTADDLYKTPQLRDADIVMLSKKLKGVRIKVIHLTYEREYRVLRLTREAANRLEFTTVMNQGTGRKKVSDYFLEKYKRKLRYPHLPCLQVNPEQKRVYLPLEVCVVLQGQYSNERLTELQTSEMIRVAAVKPEERFRKIQQVLRDSDFNNDPCNVQFGIRVSSKPLSLEGRIIDPPNVMYCNQKRILPKNGSWEMKSEKFLKGADVGGSWVMLSFVRESVCNNDDLQKFARMLHSVALDHGLHLGSLDCVETSRVISGQVGSLLKNILKRFCNVKLAVVVLQGKNSPFYGEVKQAAETVIGLTTQCVEVRNVKKLNPTVMSNICQKLNAKMGGINSALTPGEKPAIFNKPVIIIGADVTHPPPGSVDRPSIAAAVGSLDSYPSRYAVSIRVQKAKYDTKKAVEIILDLENMVKDLMIGFYQNTRKKPEKIIFYRDGVSEGQFAHVCRRELLAIQNACSNLEAGYKPAITVIIVQKRHHTRFIPRDLRDGLGPTRNVPPGTVVDRVASSRIYFDYFLCSQYGLQGTSKPAHYTVIFDDNKFTSDELQKLTYYLCHIYARCTRSISIPAPVAYAHLAASRAAKYIAAELSESSSGSDISAAQHRILQSTWERIIKIKPELMKTMFFV